MTNLSVLLLTEPLRGGEVTDYAAAFLNGLTERGVNVHLAAAGLPPNSRNRCFVKATDRMALFPSLSWGWMNPWAFLKLRSWAVKHKPQIIHGLSAFVEPSCRNLAKVLDTPWLLTIHHYQNRGSLHADRWCRGYVALSDALRTNLVNEACVPKELITVLPLGIALPELKQTPKPAAGASAKSLPLIVSCGALTERKDFPTLLRAARKVLDHCAGECHFLIAGEGPKERTLRRLRNELGLSRHITFCTDDSFSDEVWASAYLYVQPSLSDAFNIEVVTAAAWGAPVIAAASGGLISQVTNGKTGFLFPPGDVDALAEKIILLLEDPDQRNALGEAGREMVGREYSLPQMLDNIVSLYKKHAKP